MQKFTQLIGAKVISAHNCEYLGTVLNMYINIKNCKIKYLVLSGADDETTYILPTNRIFAINNAVIVRNKTAISVSSNIELQQIMNSTIISISGKDYGHIVDMELDEKLHIDKILTNENEILPSKIIGLNNGLILINDTDKKYTNFSFAPHHRLQTQENAKSITVHALNQDEQNFVATPRTIIARLPKNFKLPK